MYYVVKFVLTSSFLLRLSYLLRYFKPLTWTDLNLLNSGIFKMNSVFI